MVKLFIVAALGAFSAIGGTIAQATPGGSDVSPFLSAGGGMTAVAALAVFARYMAQGKLVPRDIAVTEAQLVALLEKNQTLLAEGYARELGFLEAAGLGKKAQEPK